MSVSYSNAKSSLTDVDTFLAYIQKTFATATSARYDGTNAIVTFSSSLTSPQQTTLTALVTAYVDPVVGGNIDPVQVSVYNSSSTALAANGVYTGTWEDCSRYNSVTVSVLANVASATSGLSVQFGNLSAQADLTKTYSVSAATHFTISLPLVGRWFRIAYTNGATLQASMYLQVKFSNSQVSQIVDANSIVNDSTTALLTRNLNMGRQDVGNYVSVRADESKVLRTRESRDSALAVNSGASPIVQLDFPYNLNTDLVTTVLATSGTVTFATGCAAVATAALAASSATLKSRYCVHAGVGRALRIVASCAFTTGAANSTQMCGWGSIDNGLFFGYNGTAFGICVRNATVDTWTAATAFNVDKLDGTGASGVTLDPTKGNVYAIILDGTGFGSAVFGILTTPVANTTDFIACHRVSFGNSATTLGIKIATGHLYAQSINTTNTSALTIRVAGMAAFADGPSYPIMGRLRSVDAAKTVSTLTDTPILSVFDKTTFQTVNNYSSIVLQSLSCGVDGTKGMVVFTITDGATLTNSSFADISANTSACQLDTAATSMTGGTVLCSFCVQCTACTTIDLSQYNIRASPNMTLTVAAHCTASGTTNAVAASLCFREEC